MAELLYEAIQNNTDEYYTLYKDIEKECQYYIPYFKDKIIYCNCDNPYESNFVKYFINNFNAFGLKKLIATCCNGKPLVQKVDLFSDHVVGIGGGGTPAYCLVITKVMNNTEIDGLIKEQGNSLTMLKYNGDFRGEECVEILQQADIVITNPPFSLFSDFMDVLMTYKKKFIVMGNVTAITSSTVFPHIINNEIQFGKSIHCGGTILKVPNDYSIKSTNVKYTEDAIYKEIPGVRWYTNIGYNYPPKLELKCTYTPEQYPKYDNFDTIDVSQTVNIPKDYYGVMGVPITFIDKYNPQQFKILGCSQHDTEYIKAKKIEIKLNGEIKFTRLFIQRID